jgi:excisionase family DNA binding protein
MAKRQQPEPEGALYVRLPSAAVAKLDRASEALGVHKKDLIAGLVAKYVDPDSKRGLSALGELSQPRRVTVDLGAPTTTVGAYSFRSYDPPEVMNAAQAAELLQLDETLVLELAEAGKLPGKKLGTAWRFARGALIAWLSTPE